MLSIPLWSWMLDSVTGFCVLLFNAQILRKELNKRSSQNIIWVSKYLRIFSFACLISGVAVGFFHSLTYVPGFCYFSFQFSWCFIILQVTSMIFFQIAQLHYCFSQTKSHSQFGYSTTLFVILYIIGIVCTTIMLTLFLISINGGYCGINDKYIFVSHDNPNDIVSKFVFAASAMFVSYDFLILILYIIKLYKFFKEIEQTISRRIKSILIRLILPKLFYEMFHFIYAAAAVVMYILNIDYVSDTIGRLLGSFVLVSISYSMLIMQEHNSMEYQRFLKKVYCICRCCRPLIVKEIEDLEEVQESVNEDNKRKNIDDTIYETRGNDISIKPIPKVELSVETMQT